MHITLVILLLICSVAIARPLWGLAILLITDCSIFNLHRYATIQLPVGYAGTSDIFIVCLLIGAYLHARRKARQHNPILSNSMRATMFSPLRVLCWAILPYLIWFTACSLRGIILEMGNSSLNSLLRHAVASVLPWSIVPCVWLMRDQAKEIVKIVIVVASLTAIVHIAIQILDYRSAMHAAYWASASGITDEYQEYILTESAFVRGLPQGIILMLYCQIFCLLAYLTSKELPKKNLIFLLLSLLQIAAIGITFTRSLMTEILAGSALAVFFASKLSDSAAMIRKRTLGAIAAATFCLLIVASTKPQILDFWGERLVQLGDDFNIFSLDVIRGMDNIASLKAIGDQPILGWGTFYYPDTYSYREMASTDIHPLLELGLIGGIPCMLFFICMLWAILYKFWINSRRDTNLYRQMLPYLTILAATLLVINTIGSGSTISGSRLVAMALFIGLTAAEFENGRRRGHNAQNVSAFHPKKMMAGNK